MLKFLLSKWTVWRCGELSQESSEWWCLVRCQLGFSLEHFWFTDSLGLTLCQTCSCDQAITNEVWSCETCDCDMCPQACDIYFDLGYRVQYAIFQAAPCFSKWFPLCSKQFFRNLLPSWSRSLHCLLCKFLVVPSSSRITNLGHDDSYNSLRN